MVIEFSYYEQAFEEQIAQLSFWKQSTQKCQLDLEKENDGLKQRLQRFLGDDVLVGEPQGCFSPEEQITRRLQLGQEQAACRRQYRGV